MLPYYDATRDEPSDGLILTEDLLALLHDTLQREPDAPPLVLSVQALSGLCALVTLMGNCLGDIRGQLYPGDGGTDPGADTTPEEDPSG